MPLAFECGARQETRAPDSCELARVDIAWDLRARRVTFL